MFKAIENLKNNILNFNKSNKNSEENIEEMFVVQQF